MVKSHKKGGKWADGRRRLPDNLDELEGDPYKKREKWAPKEGWSQWKENKKEREANMLLSKGANPNIVGPINP